MYERSNETNALFHFGDGTQADRELQEVVREKIDDLRSSERDAIRWFYGIGDTCLDSEEIADRLGVETQEVWEFIREGVEEIGFRLVGEVAA